MSVLVLAAFGCNVPSDGVPSIEDDWSFDGTFEPGETPDSPDAFTWRFQSTLYAQIDSMVLHRDSDLGRAGMRYGITCDVYRSIGTIGSDYDYPGEEEEVLDVRDDDDMLLISTGDRLFLEAPSSRHVSMALPGVLDAAFSAGPVVALTDDGTGCAAQFIDAATVHVPLDAGYCVDGRLTASVVDNEAWVHGAAGVIHVTPAGAEPVDTASNLASWDDTAEALYVGAVAGTTLSALEHDGATRWTVELGAPLAELHTMGDLGAAGVMLRNDDGSGEFRVYDGVTGLLRSSVVTPNAPNRVTVSPEGSAVGLIRNNTVHFFEAEGL